MKRRTTSLQTRLYLVTIIMLLVGFGSASVIYLKAEHDSGRAIGYEEERGGGYVNPIMPEDSKIYQHDLELYGGKANVLANEFRRWFTGLWHGKSLAFTVAFLTSVISCGLFLIARHSPSDLQSADRGENNPGGTD